GVGGALRMASERLHAAQRNGALGDAQAAKEVERRGLAALKLDREEAAGVRALLFEDALLLGILEQRRINHGLQLRVSVERLRQALGVLALAVHAQRNGGKAAVEGPAFVRLEDGAEHVALAANA